MLIVEGELIHHVGYRPFLLVEALKRKKITNFEAHNFKKDDHQRVIINMVGEEQKILEFVDFIKNNFPDYASNCKIVEEKDSCPSEVMHINEFRDTLSVEQQSNIVQGGLQISSKINLLGTCLGGKIDSLRTETTDNFEKMDIKYDAISKGMFDIVREMKETNKSFDKRMKRLEDRNEIVDIRIEKMDKHIETLLEILVEQKKQN